MTNNEAAYVKSLEEQNEKFRERLERLEISYEAMVKYFVLTSMTDTYGRKSYAVAVKNENIGEISENDYTALSMIGMETEPHVDMRVKTGEEDLERLNKIIEEGYQEMRKYGPR